MSDALQVFLSRENVPNIEVLISILRDQGLLLEEWGDEAKSLHDVDGFWPGEFKGSEAGFEFFMGELDDDDLEAWNVEREQLEDRDMMVELCYYTETDLLASVMFITLICELYGGITFDEDDELTITSKNSKQWKD